MADFKTALSITGHNEGGYSFNHADTGGETLFGVSRKNWPNWPGWKIVDEFKGQPKFISIIESSRDLKSLANDFYKQNFWNPLQLDLIHDQQIANNVYDFGINAGVGKSAQKLQLSCDVPVDGQVGSITISAVNNGIAEDIYDKFNILRKAYYLAIIERDPSQAQFKASWMSRIKPYVK